MSKVPRSLAGSVVAITGGARGIGRATAVALIAQGARVAIGDIEAQLAEQAASELGAGTVGLPLDVTDRGSFAAFLDQVEDRLGPLDVLINNAGIMPIGPFLEETDSTAQRIIDINVGGVIFGSKLALERFSRRGRGHLVNIASMAGKAGAPHLATYCASKFAVVGLTEALRQEFQAAGIDMTVVMPVGVNTELYSGLQPMRGMKTPEPEDVAEAIVEALRTRRYEVYVPKRMNAILRLSALLPRRTVDAVARAMGSDQLMIHPDHTARAAYEARIARRAEGVQAAAAQAESAAAKAQSAAAQAESAAEGNGSATAEGNGSTETEPARETETV
jgi:NAD(P)-dependent dehydrogenase (short-subunit alcohol dehydrogenase family)